MATQALAVPGGRRNRLVVLVNDDEMTHIKAQAQAAAMSVSDFLRNAALLNGMLPTEAEEIMIRDVLQELEEASARSDAALAKAEATAAYAANFDEDAYRAKLTAEFEAMDIDWDAVAIRLGFVQDEAA